MAKFYGIIGFAITKETRPGVWEEVIEERPYYGDLNRCISNYDSNASSTNDNLRFNNSLSIIADPFANENFSHIKYASFMGAKWKVSSVEVQYPRLVLTFGGVYNGPTD